MKTITYTEAHIPSHIINDIIESNKNTHVNKKKCGCGATYSTLCVNNKKIILCVPKIKLVEDKEEQYRNGHFNGSNCEFLYGDSITRARDIKPVNVGGHIVVGTVNQILKLDNVKFAEEGYTLIIDELHTAIYDSNYRDEYCDVFETVCKEYIKYNALITITATPLFKFPKYMNKFEDVIIERDIKEEDLDVYLVDSFSGFKAICQDNIIEGNDVVIFTNDFKYINELYHGTEYNEIQKRIKTIVGDKIRGKIKCLYEDEDEIECKKNIYICSSAGTEGIDIYLDNPTIFIHNKPETEYGSFNCQTLIQAIGRARNGFKNVYIYNDPSFSKIRKVKKDKYSENEVTSIENEKISYSIISKFEKLSEYFSNYGYSLIEKEDTQELMEKWVGKNKKLSIMIKYLLNLDDNKFQHYYNLTIYDCKISHRFYGTDIKTVFAYICTNIIKITGMTHNVVDSINKDVHFERELSSFRNVLYSLGLLKSRFLNKHNYIDHVKSNISVKKKVLLTGFKDYSFANAQRSFTTKSSKEEDIVSKLDIKMKNAELNEIDEEMTLFEVMYSLYYPLPSIRKKIREYTDTKSTNMKTVFHFLENKHKSIIKKIYNMQNKIKRLKDEEKINTTKEEIITLEKKSKKYDKEIKVLKDILDNFKINQKIYKLTKEELTKNLLESLVEEEILTDEDISDLKYESSINLLKSIAGFYCRKFTSGNIYKKHRNYHSVAQCSKTIMQIAMPYGIIESDIINAYPSFINCILGIDKFDVYDKIMSFSKCNRKTAKIKFNSMINSNLKHIKKEEKIKFLVNECGYTEEQAEKIYNLNIADGQIHMSMNIIEEQVTKIMYAQLRRKFELLATRRHDSIVLFPNYQFYIENKDNFEYENKEIEVNVFEKDIVCEYKTEFYY
jgi:hypothetical protein